VKDAVFPRESPAPEKQLQWFGLISDYVYLSDPMDRVAVFEVPQKYTFPRKGWERLGFWKEKAESYFSVPYLNVFLKSDPNCCR